MSISVEEQFYLVWPTLCRRFNKRAISVALVPLAAAAVAMLVRRGANADSAIWTNSLVQFQMFGLGALLAIFLNGRVPVLSMLVRSLLLGTSAVLFGLGPRLSPALIGPSATGALISAYFGAGIASCILLVAVLGALFPRG